MVIGVADGQDGGIGPDGNGWHFIDHHSFLLEYILPGSVPCHLLLTYPVPVTDSLLVHPFDQVRIRVRHERSMGKGTSGTETRGRI